MRVMYEIFGRLMECYTWCPYCEEGDEDVFANYCSKCGSRLVPKEEEIEAACQQQGENDECSSSEERKKRRRIRVEKLLGKTIVVQLTTGQELKGKLFAIREPRLDLTIITEKEGEEILIRGDKWVAVKEVCEKENE